MKKSSPTLTSRVCSPVISYFFPEAVQQMNKFQEKRRALQMQKAFTKFSSDSFSTRLEGVKELSMLNGITIDDSSAQLIALLGITGVKDLLASPADGNKLVKQAITKEFVKFIRDHREAFLNITENPVQGSSGLGK